jgi:hypothetical protein
MLLRKPAGIAGQKAVAQTKKQLGSNEPEPPVKAIGVLIAETVIGFFHPFL